MADQLDPHEAARALAQIRADQERVIDHAVTPLRFYWAIAALIVMLGVVDALKRPVLSAIGFGLFLLGIAIAVAWVLWRSRRFRPRRELFGPASAAILFGYVILTSGGHIAALYLFKASGVPYAGFLAGLVLAILIVSAAPLLNAGLRRVMLANRRIKP